MKRPSPYERVVAKNEHVPIDVVLRLFRELIEALGFEIIVEETHSYTAYDLRKKPSLSEHVADLHKSGTLAKTGPDHGRFEK